MPKLFCSPETLSINNIRFRIGNHLIWFDGGRWQCGSHEVDTMSCDSLQDAVDHALWVINNPDLYSKQFI